jgi:hypothetical protein
LIVVFLLATPPCIRWHLMSADAFIPCRRHPCHCAPRMHRCRCPPTTLHSPTKAPLLTSRRCPATNASHIGKRWRAALSLVHPHLHRHCWCHPPSQRHNHCWT